MGNQRNEKNVAPLEKSLVLSGIWDVFSISVVVVMFYPVMSHTKALTIQV